MSHMRNCSLEQAVELIKLHTKQMPVVTLALEDVCKEVVAEDCIAANDQPPFPRSPLDGYAFRGEDSVGATREHPVTLTVMETYYAGDDKQVELHPGQAVRIMTGGVIPEGANAVIRQEDTDYGQNQVSLYKEIKPYRNYCFQGEDYKKGQRLIKQGTILDYTAVAILASNGISRVKVHRKPKIAVISTGDELISPGESLRPGKIYDSNRYLLHARLRELGMECTFLHANDTVEAVKKQIATELSMVDAVITTGGVSVGEKDILNEVLKSKETTLIFEGLKMKPGSPAKFALFSGKPVLALSGNPFAAAATFELLARPMLGAMMGTDEVECKKETALLVNGFAKASPQRRLIRGVYEQGKVQVPTNQSSGQIGSMLGCNCLVDIPAGSEAIPENSLVQVMLL